MDDVEQTVEVAPPEPLYGPPRASRLTRTAGAVTAVAPPTMLVTGFLGGMCANGELQPCFYPWAGLAGVGAIGTVAGPVALLVGAEKDRKRFDSSRRLSWADAGLVSLATGAGLLAVAPFVDGQHTSAAGTGALIGYAAGLTCAGVQLARNDRDRVEAWRADVLRRTGPGADR